MADEPSVRSVRRRLILLIATASVMMSGRLRAQAQPFLFVGDRAFDAVGQDLEGFWDPREAEGGATLFLGPTTTRMALRLDLGR